jgi:hypothetical protein
MLTQSQMQDKVFRKQILSPNIRGLWVAGRRSYHMLHATGTSRRPMPATQLQSYNMRVNLFNLVD